MNTKKCTKCGQVKQLNDFGKDKNRKGGRYPQCKECRAKYYEENREHIRKQEKERYDKNCEAVKAAVRRYRKNNPEVIRKKIKKII